LKRLLIFGLFAWFSSSIVGRAQVLLDTLKNPKSFMGFVPLSDTLAEAKNGVFVLPLLYFTPDTRWAAGAAGVYYFKVPPSASNPIHPRVSYIQFLADYTQNKQLDTWASWHVFTQDENYLLKGDLRYRDFPDRFYGLGNDSEILQKEQYSYQLFVLKTLQLKKIRPGFFLGFDYEFRHEYNFNHAANGQLESGAVTGSNGGFGSALGLVSILDTRDNIINPYRGHYAEFSTYFFTPLLKSTFSFQTINATYQKYWQFKPKHVLAWQTKARFSFGEVPFLDLSTLGNDDILRGYPKNRFRDQHFFASQLEYRFPLFWRFGAVAFAGAGDVFGPSSNLSAGNVKYSVGTGLRFVVDPAERLNIRLDYGYGREGGYFYFVVGESF
jgi:outer membrane protein assembly factor BamA